MRVHSQSAPHDGKHMPPNIRMEPTRPLSCVTVSLRRAAHSERCQAKGQPQKAMRRPLSAIIKEMSLTIFGHPEAVPSSEAAHAALLLAHVAWNRSRAIATPSVDFR
jgi:hypothetical protein